MIRNITESVTVGDLRVAMVLGRPVTIDYENADGVRSVRVVEIFEIVDRTDARKHPFFRAMDRRSGDFRAFRFDRLYAYRVSNARGRYRVPRPAAKNRPELTVFTTTAPPAPVDTDAEWGAWFEATYDPDAPVPYLPTPYLINEEKSS